MEECDMWEDDTRTIPLKKYEEAQDRFFSYFASTPGVVRYGTFGSIGAPGLSDLDLVVVVEDECLAKKKFSLPKLQEDEKYIFTHSPLVIPASMLNLLPYYHLIDIKWADGLPDSDQIDLKNLPLVSSLHVLNKTLYLQAFLWGMLMLFNAKRPCKRSILALTSVARSVQWLQNYSIPVKESENNFVNSILSFRTSWINSENRDEHIRKLDHLLFSALKIAIELPETLSLNLLGAEVGRSFTETMFRGLQSSPMNFILETPVHSAELVIRSVQEKHSLVRLAQCCGKFRPFIMGNFAFSGPITFAIRDLDFCLSKDYYNSIGGYRWGGAVDQDLSKAVEQMFAEPLQRKFTANFKFAKAMKDAGLRDSNFGSVWMAQDFRGELGRFLAQTTGRLRIIRRLQSGQSRGNK